MDGQSGHMHGMSEEVSSRGVGAGARVGDIMQRKVVWDQLVLDRGRSRRTGRSRLFRRAAPAASTPARDREDGSCGDA